MTAGDYGAIARAASTGTVTETVYGAGGSQETRPSRPFATTFALRQFSDGRWLTTDTLPYDS